MDRLESLAAFVRVVDLGGFSKAARAMRVSTPGITRAIAALEERLGVSLLHRTTRSMRLTEEGAVFLPRARQVLADLQDAEHVVMGAQSEPKGLLVVTAPVVFGRTHVVPVIAELLPRYPRLSIQLLLLDRLVHLAEEGVDIAVRIGDLTDSALQVARLGDVRRVLVASPAYFT
jgi:DNA-binding transcriptional LysR family regulator